MQFRYVILFFVIIILTLFRIFCTFREYCDELRINSMMSSYELDATLLPLLSPSAFATITSNFSFLFMFVI